MCLLPARRGHGSDQLAGNGVGPSLVAWLVACALWVASVGTLVSNAAFGPGQQGPVVGSLLLLHPAPPPALLTSFYLFLFGYAGFSLLHQLFPSCGKEGLLSSCRAQASHCGGFCACGDPRGTGFRNCDI